MDKKITNLKIDLENIFKDRLVSIILYGSAAFGEFHNKVSDINLLIVLDKLNAADLKNAYPAIKKWKSTKNPVPVFMGKQELLNSCDIYPIEYSDIRERHKILFGEDFFDELDIEKLDLRLQCEAELRKLLIKLRQSYLANSNDKKVIENLIMKSSTSFLAIFRALLRLLDLDVPNTHRETLELLSSKINFDGEVFFNILSLRENKRRFSHKNSVETVQKLINSLNQILQYVDKLDKC